MQDLHEALESIGRVLEVTRNAIQELEDLQGRMGGPPPDVPDEVGVLLHYLRAKERHLARAQGLLSSGLGVEVS